MGPALPRLLLSPSVRARAKELGGQYPGVSEILGKIADGITVEGMEAFSAVLADRMDLLLDDPPVSAVVLACDPERIRTRAVELVATSQEFLEASWASAASGGEAPVDLGGSAFQPIEMIREAAVELGIAWWTLAPFGFTDDVEDAAGPAGTAEVLAGGSNQNPSRITFTPRPRPPTAARPPASSWTGATGSLTAGGSCSRPKVTGPPSGWPRCCAAKGSARGSATWTRRRRAASRRGDRRAAPGLLLAGRAARGAHRGGLRRARHVAAELAGRRRMPSARPRGGVDPLQLKPGDYVVHEQHGVGRLVEMTSRTTAGITRDYLVVEGAEQARAPGGPAVRADPQTVRGHQYVGGEAPRCTGSAARTGPRPRAARARPCGRSRRS